MVLRARPVFDEDERTVVGRLSRARKAPRDAVMRARVIQLSWSGLWVPAIAVELDCSQKTVRCRLHRFNRSGLQGLEDPGGQGRRRRITEEERSRIISLVKDMPPGRLRWEPVGQPWAFDESGPSEWTLDSLAAAAGRRDPGGPLTGQAHPARRRRAPAPYPVLDALEGSGLRPKGQGSSASILTRPPTRR
ncbi:helix-turn-helix domain-containing protein [Streptomyces sp. NPDC052101]|uniref:helix-turn-helix domain-containing protein n=1 Tax=Streptomyces sp. NPDC052101 TaxID=3155763 RepID=UPI00343091CE